MKILSIKLLLIIYLLVGYARADEEDDGDELTEDERNDPVVLERELRTSYKLRIH